MHINSIYQNANFDGGFCFIVYSYVFLSKETSI